MVQSLKGASPVFMLVTLPGVVQTKYVDGAALWITKTVNMVL